jgi:hypothetical protein
MGGNVTATTAAAPRGTLPTIELIKYFNRLFPKKIINGSLTGQLPGIS